MDHFYVAGATSVRQPDSTCFISYWHIPFGFRYDLAEVRKVYLADKKLAEKIAKLLENPPEMAFVSDLT